MKIFDGFKYNTTHGVLTAIARKDGGFDFDGGAYRVDADGATYWVRPAPEMPVPFKVLGIFEEPALQMVVGAWYATEGGPKLCREGYVVGSYKCSRTGMRNGGRYALHKLENYQPAERTALIDNAWYTCSDGTTRCANKQFAGLFTMEEMGTPEAAVVVDGFGRYAGQGVGSAQFVIAGVSAPLPHAEQLAPPAPVNLVDCPTNAVNVNDPQRAVCVMRASAKVEVQVMVDYYPDTTAAHIKEEAEKMARANLPKGVTVLEVQGLDIRL